MIYINQQVQDGIDKNSGINQFAVTQTPFHTHNGLDSPSVSFQNLSNRSEILHVVIFGTQAATAGNYNVFFTAPYKCLFMGATEVHSVLGTDASAVTLQIEKLTGTTASGSGTNLLSAGFNLKGTINTVQTANLALIPNTNFNLAIGDRLGLSLTGTPTSVANVVIVVKLSY